MDVRREFMLMRRIGGTDAVAYETDQVKAAYRSIQPGQSFEVTMLRASSKRDALERQTEARGWKVITKKRDGSILFGNPPELPLERMLPGFSASDWQWLQEEMAWIESMPAGPKRRSRVIKLLAQINNEVDGVGVDFIDDDIVYVDRNSADKPTVMFLCDEGCFVVGSLREGIDKVKE
jgi:hypothetical protein